MTGYRPLVLIHDDDADITQTVCDVLKLLNYRVIAFSSPMNLECMTFIDGPDCVILDLMLQREKSGIELAQGLRRQGLQTPLVAISASPMLANQARDSGLFAEVIDKPFSVTDLAATLQRLAPMPGYDDAAEA